MFRSDPRDNGVKLLLSVEEGSYIGESLCDTQASMLTWCKTRASRRAIIRDMELLILLVCASLNGTLD
jgi:hypothetical protein